jgi:ABC-type multidrug transport system fused ATPase/permease subunit
MNNDFLEIIEPTPKLHSKKCKIISTIICFFLKYSIYVVSIFSWYIYDYFIAFFTLILSFIIIGIIRSKLRNNAIQLKQREYQYNDKGIADWYTAKEICNDDFSNAIIFEKKA